MDRPDEFLDAQQQARWLAAVACARDRLARFEPPFIWLEAGRRMAERLPLLRMQPQRVLDAGCAWGDGLDLLRRQYPQAQIVGYEPSPRLAQVASARFVRGGWVRWFGRASAVQVRAADATDPEYPAQADVLWSNLDLLWQRDRPRVFAAWRRQLQPEGALFFTTFGPDTLKELTQVCQDIGYASLPMPHTDMHDLGDELVHAGFADPVMDMELVRLSWPSAQAALRELRTLGAVPHDNHAPGLRTPRAWRRLEQAVDAAARARDGRVTLTFELIYGHAFRPRTERAHAGQATFDVAQLRQTARQPRLPRRPTKG
ncbi:methyltransferase domain-containing protein [Thiomonas sp.]|uniref:methyltransferase domain-containing protein n=1 Tax=Thiomonas sp. TaxID=2047785 RepID=UPI0026045421|nr:methyltransferase domain-containing protein [Thiomonas sp.]